MFCPKKICSKKIAHSWPYLKTNFHQKAPFSSIISLFHRSILHYKMKHLESLTFHYRTCISKYSSKMAASQGCSQPHSPRCKQEFHFPHFSSKFPSFFSSYFSSNFPHFCPHFGSLGGRVNHPEGQNEALAMPLQPVIHGKKIRVPPASLNVHA